jgi:two-component system, chemotaxis family, chemotaxis protein CheY
MLADSTMPILVVDDEEIALALVSRLLTRIGFGDIDRAHNGVVACDMLKAKKYGLVICDWNMPEMNGLDLLKIVRADDRWKRLPFLMTSIDGSLERVKLARLAGVSAFLLKPFDETKLRAKLEEVVSGPLPKRKSSFDLMQPEMAAAGPLKAARQSPAQASPALLAK